jgi:endonuclease/exonuclease/phosphatase family metal-dependent hydrolase
VRLTFASYNIHKAVGLDRRRDPERILRVLHEIDADIVALQEVDRRIGDRASVLPRAEIDDTRWRVIEVARRPRSIGWHGNALLVRREYEVVGGEALELPTLEPRGAA